tara:strand:- start:450 stop:944 length:495 start_codon:yes stop_codon:yes gene_type:complete
MKFLLFISAFILSSAAVANDVIAEFKPVSPASCKQRGVEYLNITSNIITIEEGSLVEINFSSVYGKCNFYNKLEVMEFSPYAGVGVMKSGISLPGEYEPVASVGIVNEKLARVKVEVDKDIIFANTNTATLKMKVVPVRGLYFYWWINLTYDPIKDITTVKFAR